MSGDVTIGALKRLTYLPDIGRDAEEQGELIAGQYYFDVLFTGGDISGVTIHDLVTPLAPADGGTGSSLSIGQLTTTSSVINFYAYSPSSIGSSSDLTSVIQTFLLYCQLQALVLKSASGTDANAQRSYVTAYLPRGRYTISCPIVVPEFVNLKCDGIFVRTGQTGTITNFYTGDTTTQALVNLYQPAVIIVPHAHCEKTQLICNSNGSDRGSGLFAGKNWTAASYGITASGISYQVGDVLTFSQPSISPYVAATATVSSVNGSGAITGVSTPTGNACGAYALPPVLQTIQWTSANGFTGVFDAHGNLAVSGGSGSGASLSINWQADFPTPSYSGGLSGLIGSTLLGHLDITQSSTTSDGTYGPSFCLGLWGLNFIIDEVECQNGRNAFWFQASDVRANKLNNVGGTNPIVINGGASVECPVCVWDTPGGGSVIIDGVSNLDLKGVLFLRNNQNPSPTNPTFQVGQFHPNNKFNENIKLNFEIRDGGAGQTNPSNLGCYALAIDYTRGYDINLNVTNYNQSFTGQYPLVTGFVNFTGTNCFPNGRITGSIDYTYSSIITGTNPRCYLNVWDANCPIVNAAITATVTGTITANDVITLTFTNSLLTNAFGYPRTPHYTVLNTDTTTTIATALAAAINADTGLVQTGITATSNSNVVTINGYGLEVNSTVVTSSVSGSATEIITLSNSGALSGSISGGTLATGGIYQLAGAGAPVSTVGKGRAGAGSIYYDYTNGVTYQNTGSSSSPVWTKQMSTNAPSGTFATLPAASTGRIYFATDIGTNGILLISNGSVWKPATGVAALYVDPATHQAVGTGVEANYANYKIPAGLLTANGSLRITGQMSCTGTTGGKTIIIRHTIASGSVSGGTTLVNNSFGGSATTITGNFQKFLQNNNSVFAQICLASSFGSYGTVSGTAETAGTINTANDSWINFNINGNASDTVGYAGVLIEWLEP